MNIVIEPSIARDLGYVIDNEMAKQFSLSREMSHFDVDLFYNQSSPLYSNVRRSRRSSRALTEVECVSSIVLAEHAPFARHCFLVALPLIPYETGEEPAFQFIPKAGGGNGLFQLQGRIARSIMPGDVVGRVVVVVHFSESDIKNVISSIDEYIYRMTMSISELQSLVHRLRYHITYGD